MAKCYQTVSEDYQKEVKNIRRSREALLLKRTVPSILQLAFDVKSRTGGSLGTMKHAAKLSHNNGFDIAIRLLDPVEEQFPTIIAVEITGGPKVPFHPGREVVSHSPGIKNACSDHLTDVFYTKGLNDQDVVAHSGGHTLVS
ncbi:hypothetical protein MKW92_052906 [Papaver armeniacum]|nr:hypothetical protein MKW92_052906 [Papaver armeniacum]